MKIGFTGTMSVGKSTLVKALQDDPMFQNYQFRTERSKYLRDLGIPLNTDSTIKGQTIFLAERATELMIPNIITDRTVIDVIAFTNLSDTINQIQKEDFEAYAKHLIGEYDIIFYIPQGNIPIEDNGVRETDPVYRDEVNNEIFHLLTKYTNKTKIFSISGTTEERIRKIKGYL